MVRAQVQLSEEQLSELKELAAERGVSVAQLVREGVGMVLRECKGMSREERRRRALALPAFRSGVSDVSVRHDEYFAESASE